MSEQTETGAMPEQTEAQQSPAATAGDGLGDAGKRALEAEREARKAAERKAKELEERLAAIEAERERAAEDEAAKRGEFERLATERQAKIEKLEAQLQSVREERDALAARVAAYEERDSKRAETLLKSLPEGLRKLYPASLPLEERLVWLETALADAEAHRQTPAGNRPGPRPASGATRSLEDEKAALSRTGLYSL